MAQNPPLVAQRGREDEERLTADIIELARQSGRYGYRKIAELLRQAGWTINDKRVERIWQREGLKVPHKQSGRTHRSDTSRQHRRYLSLPSPRGRLRYANRLRRPR